MVNENEIREIETKLEVREGGEMAVQIGLLVTMYFRRSRDSHNRARHQLAASFAGKSSAIVPESSGTDIFGGLWHLKALFESSPKSQGFSKSIWIFSDMMNETKEFPMPTLVAMGPQRMLERAQGHGLLVPLRGYRIYIYGASPKGLTAEVWKALRDFWTIYFSASGAELVSYSAECKVLR